MVMPYSNHAKLIRFFSIPRRAVYETGVVQNFSYHAGSLARDDALRSGLEDLPNRELRFNLIKVGGNMGSAMRQQLRQSGDLLLRNLKRREARGSIGIIWEFNPGESFIQVYSPFPSLKPIFATRM
jgi:hypothetical protein